MSNPELPRPPAFAQLRPRPADVVSATGVDVRALCAALDVPEHDIKCLQGEGGLLPGKFIVLTDGGRLFVKQVGAAEIETHELADRICRHSQQAGARCVVMAPEFPSSLDQESILLGWPYVEHRFATFSCSDLHALGAELRTLHDGLRVVPQRDLVRELTLKRFEILERAQAAVRNGESCMDAIPREVRTVLCEVRLDRHSICGSRAQVVHGDLNYANVCFSIDTAIPYFIDFESTCRSWLDVTCDLAQVLDRFILTGRCDIWSPLYSAFETGYRGTGDLPVWRAEVLLVVLEQLAVRSLLLLAARRAEGLPVADTEWRKFLSAFERTSLARVVKL